MGTYYCETQKYVKTVQLQKKLEGRQCQFETWRCWSRGFRPCTGQKLILWGGGGWEKKGGCVLQEEKKKGQKCFITRMGGEGRSSQGEKKWDRRTFVLWEKGKGKGKGTTVDKVATSGRQNLD